MARTPLSARHSMVSMGWCHEFGVTVREECGHPMRAGEAACQCPECGVVCEGQFAGCSTVWAAGPREVVLSRPVTPVAEPPVVNGGSAPGFNGKPAPVVNDDSVLAGSEGAASVPISAVQTAWPGLAVHARSWRPTPQVAAHTGEPEPEPVAEPAEPELAAKPAPLVAASDERRSQIFEWLRDSFEGVNSQMRVLSDSVSRQQQVLAGMTDAEEAAARLSQLADALPERIGAAVKEAVIAGQRAGQANPEQGHLTASTEEPPLETDQEQTHVADGAEERPPVTDEDWIAAMEDVVVELGPPTQTGIQTPETSSLEGEPRVLEADAPVAEPIAGGVDEPGRPADDPPPGFRTQLTGLASTVQGRINRSGWQEKLRSLSTR